MVVPQTVLHTRAPFYISTSNAQGFRSLHILAYTCYFLGGRLYIFFGKMSIQVLCNFLLGFGFLLLSGRILNILWILIPYDLQMFFFPILQIALHSLDSAL